VFNEMKGVYSSPDSLFYRAVQQALFPQNTYRCGPGPHIASTLQGVPSECCISMQRPWRPHQ